MIEKVKEVESPLFKNTDYIKIQNDEWDREIQNIRDGLNRIPKKYLDWVVNITINVDGEMVCGRDSLYGFEIKHLN